jgi:hypothetical protein
VTISFSSSLRAFVFAPLGSTIVTAAFAIFAQHADPFSVGFLLALGWVWLLSLAGGALFVAPVFLFVPRSRNPSLWFAVLWGTLAALAFSAFVFRRQFLTTSALGMIGLGGAGGASGFVCALVARRPVR